MSEPAVLEVRRHSYTKKGDGRGKGSHLSAQGVALARQVGLLQSAAFNRVVTSTVPRTLETAIAMGWAVDEQYVALGDIPSAVHDEIGHHERWFWTEPFAHFAAVVARGGPTAHLGRSQQALWVEALDAVGSGGRVLIISHGRIIEAGLVTCVPDGDYGSWGSPFRHCEGIRLTYAGGYFTDVEFLRIAHQDEGFDPALAP